MEIELEGFKEIFYLSYWEKSITFHILTYSVFNVFCHHWILYNACKVRMGNWNLLSSIRTYLLWPIFNLKSKHHRKNILLQKWWNLCGNNIWYRNTLTIQPCPNWDSNPVNTHGVIAERSVHCHRLVSWYSTIFWHMIQKNS